jgi:hypothetical protein
MLLFATTLVSAPTVQPYSKIPHQIFQLQERLILELRAGEKFVQWPQIDNVTEGILATLLQQVRGGAKLRTFRHLPHCPLL